MKNLGETFQDVINGKCSSHTKKATLASGLFFNFAQKLWLLTVDSLRNLLS
jgi:hypothetical protein